MAGVLKFGEAFDYLFGTICVKIIKMDRSNYPVNLKRLHDIDKDDYIGSLSPSQRLEMVWQLTLQAWAFKEGLEHEPRLPRSVVRTIRLKG